MPTSDARVPLTASQKTTVPGARRVGPVDPKEEVSVTILVRRRPGADAPDPVAATLGGRPLRREDFAAIHGADPADLAKVTEFARAHGLTVGETAAAQRTVKLSGPAEAVSGAFGTELARYEHPEGAYRGREGVITLPSDVAPLIEGVFGLDDRPQAHPLIRMGKKKKPVAGGPPVGSTPFETPQIAKLYNFPTDVTGAGECIGIIELGGGYNESDLQGYFGRLGIPMPTVVAVPVDGTQNTPSPDPGGADGEVALDIEVAGAVAPGAKIAVYFAPNTDQGFLDAINTAVHDTTNKPSVISISWGSAESGWTAQSMQAMDQAFADAGALGVTVTVAAGDDGACDRTTDGKAHTDFPASSPHALACGGTNLQGSGSTISSETVWNESTGGASGGGISDVFDVPTWQAGKVCVSVNPGARAGRGVPDVSGDADPATGYLIDFGGQTEQAIGGTSAVAPLWAGLIALANQSLGKPVGFLNPTLYGHLAGTAALHDITQGNNFASGVKGYSANSGWDACTGNGSPDGAQLIAALKAVPTAP